MTTHLAQLRPGAIRIGGHRRRRAVACRQAQATDRLQAHDRLELRPASGQQGFEPVAGAPLAFTVVAELVRVRL